VVQKLKSCLLTLFFFVLFCILGIIVGIGMGYGALILHSNGLFSSWELLNSDQQFEKIIRADTQTVWARASDGKVYSWDTNCIRENCNQWVEVKEIPEAIDDPQETLVIGASCTLRNGVRKAPGNVIECAHVKLRGPDYGVEVYYALLAGGKIWMWEYFISSIDLEVAPVFGGFFGLIIGFVGFIFFMARRVAKSETAST
jgi:ABC-type antimicrobial peptide transport system permease subunit